MLSTYILTFLQRDDVGSDNISAGDAAEQDVKRTISTNHASSCHDALHSTRRLAYIQIMRGQPYLKLVILINAKYPSKKLTSWAPAGGGKGGTCPPPGI